MLDRFFTNMEIIRSASLRAKIPFWNCILANAHFHYMEPTDATLSLQVNSTLAYGGRGIEYFTYFTPRYPNYHLAAIDQFGRETATWDMLRRINFQIHAMAPVLLQLRSTGVYHGPEPPEGCRPLRESSLVQSAELLKDDVNPAAGRYLIGEFQDGKGRPYLMIVNKDLSRSFRFEVRLRDAQRKLVYISPYTGEEMAFGPGMDWLAPGTGALFRVE